MNKPVAFLQSALVVCLGVGIAPNASPSGTGIPLFGGPIPGMSLTITRQIVPMERVGARLVGRPRSGSIAAITLNAPGCPANDIIIDEKATEGNSTFLQLVVPSCLREKFVQATLFLRRGSPRVRLEKSGGGWVEGYVQTVALRSASRADHFTHSASAVVVDDLGLIQLLDENANDTAPAGLRLSWTADLQTRTDRAVWHLLWPAVVLGMFVLLSWAVHKTASLAGKG